MPTFDDLTLEEVEASLATLRARRRVLKQSGKVAERKIATLQRRRDRLVGLVKEIDTQIDTLRRDAEVTGDAPVRRRGRRPKNPPVI